MRPRRQRQVVAGLLLGLLLLGAGGAVQASRSSYNKGSDGAKVFYYLLQDLGYSVTRAFDLREVEPSTRLLVLIGLPESRDSARLLDWLRPGRALLLAPPLESEAGLCHRYRLGKLEIIRSHQLSGWTSREVPHRDLKLRPSACVLKAPGSAKVLAGRPDQALAFEHPAERGELLVLAHEDLLVNANLDRDDVVVLLRRWLAARLPAGARITFLEEKRGGELAELLRRTNLGTFALHGLLWLLLLYWALAPRFGDPFTPIASTRRAFAQHARALGALYQHRGASGYMLRQQYERFLARLGGRSERRLMQNAAPRPELHRRQSRPLVAAAVATRTGRDLDSVESLLAQIEHAIQETQGRDPRSIQRHFRLSQALAALQRVSTARGGKRARKGRTGIR